MTDAPGNSTQTGQGVFNAHRDLGTFSASNRRRFVDGIAQPAPPSPILLQLQTTLAAGDTDTYRIQYTGAARTFTAALQGAASFELYRHSQVAAAPCYPSIPGGRCNTLYIVLCQCYSIQQQQLIYQQAVINGPIEGIAFYTVGGVQSIFVTNTANEKAVAFGLNATLAANPKIISVETYFGDPDNCGNIPGYCPKYPGKIPKNANNTFQLNQNDFLFAQISGNSGQPILRFS